MPHRKPIDEIQSRLRAVEDIFKAAGEGNEPPSRHVAGAVGLVASALAQLVALLNGEICHHCGFDREHHRQPHEPRCIVFTPVKYEIRADSMFGE